MFLLRVCTLLLQPLSQQLPRRRHLRVRERLRAELLRQSLRPLLFALLYCRGSFLFFLLLCGCAEGDGVLLFLLLVGRGAKGEGGLVLLLLLFSLLRLLRLLPSRRRPICPSETTRTCPRCLRTCRRPPSLRCPPYPTPTSIGVATTWAIRT